MDKQPMKLFFVTESDAKTIWSGQEAPAWYLALEMIEPWSPFTVSVRASCYRQRPTGQYEIYL